MIIYYILIHWYTKYTFSHFYKKTISRDKDHWSIKTNSMVKQIGIELERNICPCDTVTLRLILMMPVRTETRLNSIGEKISMRSEKSFWILDIRLVLADEGRVMLRVDLAPEFKVAAARRDDCERRESLPEWSRS